MIDNITFLPFDPLYQQDLLALHRSAMEKLPLQGDPTDEEKDLRDVATAYSTANGACFLVGLLNGQVAAMGGYRQVDKRTAELKRMRVRVDLQRCGIGGALLHALETMAASAGYHVLILETATARASTLAFYEKHGYRQYGTGDYGGIPTVRYRKPITIGGEPVRGAGHVE